MLITIARKEWIERMRDGQFRVMSGAVAALLMIAVAAGFLDFQRTQTERHAAQQRDRRQWMNQGDRNPHSAAHFGVYAFKPRLALSFLDAGLEPFTGSVIWVEAHYQNPPRFRPAEDATALQRFGQLTAAAVLQWFVPLLLVLLSFSAFTGEREQGTLRLLASLGVPPGRLASGKALGVLAALASVMIPAVVLGVGMLAWSHAAADSWLRLAPLAAGYGLYLALFVIASLAVSAWAPSSRAALTTLLAFWTISTFVVPRIAADVGEAVHPAPSSTDFWQLVGADMKGADGHSGSDQRILALKAETLKKYGVARAEDLPINFEGLRLQAGEEHGNEVFDRHYGKLWSAYEAQERLHHWAALCSPLLAVRSISMAMAGTDLAHLRHFTQQTESYRRALNKAMNLDVATKSKPGQYYYFGDQRLWGSIPEYRYESPGAWWALERQVLPIAILFGWFGLSLAALTSAVRGVRVA